MSRVPVSEATIPDDVCEETAALYRKIAAFLDSRGVTLTREEAGRFFGSDYRLTHPRQWGIVYYEGTEAAPFFSLDACAYGGGPASAYEPYEAMRAHLGEFYSDQSWAKAVLYRDDGACRPNAQLPTWRFVYVRDVDVPRLLRGSLNVASLDGHYVEACDHSDAVAKARERFARDGYTHGVAVCDPRQNVDRGAGCTWIPFSEL